MSYPGRLKRLGVARGVYYDRMSVSPAEVGSGNGERRLGTTTHTPLMETPQRSAYWTRVRKKWNRKGVVEIDVDNEKFTLLNCIREGLRDLLVNHPELGLKENLSADDYNHVLEKTIKDRNGEEMRFCSYASSVFATIRHAIGLSEHEFLDSIAPERVPYLQFMSNSKGGQNFFLTNDKAYFMKTEKLYYVNYFRSILGTYLDHFLDYPHSLLVKYLGLFSVTVPGEQTMYFYIMQSIFFPEERIDIRYDVKGCLAGRYQKPPEEGSKILTVYKDMNFLQEQIDIGAQKEWLLCQLEKDAEFLRTLGVQDYSLLVGYHKLHRDEKGQTLGDIVARVTKSVGRKESPAGLEDAASDGSDPPRAPTTGAEEIEIKEMATPTDQSTRVESEKKPFRRGRISFIDRETRPTAKPTHNRRLLPNTKNPLHIIDGAEYRYYLGIIDFFTLYECRQRTGRFLKSVKFCCGDHSTVPPDVYADRFLSFIREHVK